MNQVVSLKLAIKLNEQKEKRTQPFIGCVVAKKEK